MDHTELTTALDRLAGASAALEQLAARITDTDESTITRIVAQVEDRYAVQDRRTLELEARLTEMQQTIAARDQRIAELEAAGSRTETPEASGRKTIPTTTATLLAKQGLSVDTLEAGALDAALTGLSLEQRFAIKAQLLRAGLVS
jgi:chromosome segregation ATPase